MSGPRLVALGDLHAPYIDAAAVQQAVDVIRRVKPTLVVQVGDLYEFDNGSNWRASQEREKPSEEFKRGRRTADEFFTEVRRAAGSDCEIIVKPGNHDERPVKRAFEVRPELACLVDEAVRKMMTFDGVTLDEREVTLLEQYGFRHWGVIHGFGAPGSHATTYAMNILLGHLHRSYLVYTPGQYAELNAAWLGDMDHHSKNYARARRQNWNHGVAIIDDLGPRTVNFGGW